MTKMKTTSLLIGFMMVCFLISCNGLYDIAGQVVPQEYTNENYTVLTRNYTTGTLTTYVLKDYFSDFCTDDYGTTLASFHSQEDDDSLFDIIETYQNHPYGLKYFQCLIGLSNESYSGWEWTDGTPYDFGVYGTNTSQWNQIYDKNLRDVYVDTSLNDRLWYAFETDALKINCGVCNTPSHRPYLLELSGQLQLSTTSDNAFLWIQLNGSDIFGNGVKTIDFFQVSMNDPSWSYQYTWNDYTNIGPINTITFLTRYADANISINSVRMNYFIDDNSGPIELKSTENGCDYKTITIQYWYDNYTIDDGTDYDDACVYGMDDLPTREPSPMPSEHPVIAPSGTPSGMPSGHPSSMPIGVPTGTPSGVPSSTPSNEPSATPSNSPTSPTNDPTMTPSGAPTSPTLSPTQVPSQIPTTAYPSESPVPIPTPIPTGAPTKNDASSSSSGDSSSDDTITLLLLAFGLFVIIVICGTIVICLYLRNTREQLRKVKQQHGLSYDDRSSVHSRNIEMNGYHQAVPQNSIPLNPGDSERSDIHHVSHGGAHGGAHGGDKDNDHEQPGGDDHEAKEGGHTSTGEGQRISQLMGTNTSYMWQDGEGGRRVTKQGPDIDEIDLDEDGASNGASRQNSPIPAKANAAAIHKTAGHAIDFIDKVANENDGNDGNDGNYENDGDNGEEAIAEAAPAYYGNDYNNVKNGWNGMNGGNEMNEDEKKRPSNIDIEELRKASKHSLAMNEEKGKAKFSIELNDKLMGNDMIMDDIMHDMENEAQGVDVDNHAGILTPGSGPANADEALIPMANFEAASRANPISPISPPNDSDAKHEFAD